MKKLFTTLVIIAASLFSLIAHATAASACYVGYYQPKEPASLRKD